VTKASENAEVSLVTAINLYQWLREVCAQRIIRDGPAQLGGNGNIVQVDESCFRHKPKVMSLTQKLPLHLSQTNCSVPF
jgi:hypothetical protein